MFFDKTSNRVLTGVVVVVLCIAGVAIQIATTPWSTGYRDGTIQKFSTKGFFRKSYEGDMATEGSRSAGSVGNVFHFSVKDKAIAKQIENMPPFTKARLHYKEYMWTVNVETNYLVYKVDELR